MPPRLPYHPSVGTMQGSPARLYPLPGDRPVPAPSFLCRAAPVLVWKVVENDRRIASSPTTAAPPRGSHARPRTVEGLRRDAVQPHRGRVRRSTRGPRAGCRSPPAADPTTLTDWVSTAPALLVRLGQGRTLHASFGLASPRRSPVGVRGRTASPVRASR